MAKREIAHFAVNPQLLTDITSVLLDLPARVSRDLLARIEDPTLCQAVFKTTLDQASDPDVDNP